MLRTLVFIFGLTVSSFAFAAATLQGVATTSDENGTVTTLTFDNPVDAAGARIEYQNNGVQVQIPNGTSTDGQKVAKVGSGGVKSVLTAPFGDGLRAKIFFENEVLPSEIEGTAKITNDGNKVLITISKNREFEMPPQTLDNSDAEKVAEEVTSADVEAANTVTDTVVDANPAVSSVSAVPVAPAVAKTERAPKTLVSTTGSKEPKSTEAQALNLDIRKESEIPVLTATTEKKEANSATWGRMVVSLAIICLMAFGFVAFSKWYQKRGRADIDNNKIRILTQHHLGPRKSLCIVRVAGESILIGVTDQNISMLKSLALIDDEIPESVSKDFKSTMAVADKAAVAKVSSAEVADDDDFVLGNIKDRISTKLKDFRPLS